SLAYREIAGVVAQSLQDAGRIPPLPDTAIDVEMQRESDGSARMRLIFQGSARVRRMLADAVQELFGPVRTPRFLLRLGSRRVAYLSVPQQIARRRADAEHFAQLWREAVGPCGLIELQGEAGLVILREARTQAARLDDSGARTTVWG
ncbi:MAG: hypothetical protein WBA87_02415, partial [Microbacterium sp.]